MDAAWLSAGTDKELQCPSCGASLSTYLPSIDHHPTRCISCNEVLVVMSATKKNFAVALSHAPPETQQFFSWCHGSLDELDFVSLMLNLERMLGD